MAKKYNFNDNFEMLYLRHEYFARIKDVNKINISKFEGIINTTAGIMYDKHRTNFTRVGFNREDVASITRMYCVAFMGLYSVRVNQAAYDRLLEKYQNKNGKDAVLSEGDLNQKDRNNLISFLRQRLSHCSVLCERKGRNILIGRNYNGAFAKTKFSSPACSEELINSYKDHGYRKVTKKELKEAKLYSKENKIDGIFDKNGFSIVEVEKKANCLWDIEALSKDKELDGYSTISSSNYNKIYGESNSIYQNTPEQSCLNAEKERNLSDIKNIFFNLNKKDKAEKLKNFIGINNKRIGYKEEVKLARKYLKHLEKNMVL